MKRVKFAQLNKKQLLIRWLIIQFGITYQFSLFAIAWVVNAH